MPSTPECPPAESSFLPSYEPPHWTQGIQHAEGGAANEAAYVNECRGTKRQQMGRDQTRQLEGDRIRMRAAMRVGSGDGSGSLMSRQLGPTKPRRADTWAARRDNAIEQSPFKPSTYGTLTALYCTYFRTRYLRVVINCERRVPWPS
jgi:hypothetical protein